MGVEKLRSIEIHAQWKIHNEKPEKRWAVGYDDMDQANHVRDEIISLGWGTTPYLILDDVVVVVRHPDGSFTLNREQFRLRPTFWAAA